MSITRTYKCDVCGKRKRGTVTSEWIIPWLVPYGPLSWFNGRVFCSRTCFWKDAREWSKRGEIIPRGKPVVAYSKIPTTRKDRK